jgi:hypothetical protein
MGNDNQLSQADLMHETRPRRDRVQSCPVKIDSRGARRLVIRLMTSILRIAARRTAKALDRKPVAGRWDSVRAGSAWHSRANHDVQDDRVPVSRLDREEDSSVSWGPAETFFQPELRLAVTGKAGLRSGRVPWVGG